MRESVCTVVNDKKKNRFLKKCKKNKTASDNFKPLMKIEFMAFAFLVKVVRGQRSAS
jgi:hypothetical protein